jgi:hypothetical protein
LTAGTDCAPAKNCICWNSFSELPSRRPGAKTPETLFPALIHTLSVLSSENCDFFCDRYGLKLKKVTFCDCKAGFQSADKAWGMGHSAWGIAHGGWRMGDGAWGMAHGGWRMGHSAWGIAHGAWGVGKIFSFCPMPNAQCPIPNAQSPMPNAQCPMPNAQCPMPNALCPMPYAQCPIPYALFPMPYSLNIGGSL